MRDFGKFENKMSILLCSQVFYLYIIIQMRHYFLNVFNSLYLEFETNVAGLVRFKH